jgi:hypothetical protein
MRIGAQARLLHGATLPALQTLTINIDVASCATENDRARADFRPFTNGILRQEEDMSEAEDEDEATSTRREIARTPTVSSLNHAQSSSRVAWYRG